LKVPMQTLFAAGLLLSLAFTVNDGSSAPGRNAPDPQVRIACDDGLSPARGETADLRRDAGSCRDANFR